MTMLRNQQRVRSQVRRRVGERSRSHLLSEGARYGPGCRIERGLRTHDVRDKCLAVLCRSASSQQGGPVQDPRSLLDESPRVPLCTGPAPSPHRSRLRRNARGLPNLTRPLRRKQMPCLRRGSALQLDRCPGSAVHRSATQCRFGLRAPRRRAGHSERIGSAE